MFNRIAVSEKIERIKELSRKIGGEGFWLSDYSTGEQDNLASEQRVMRWEKEIEQLEEEIIALIPK